MTFALTYETWDDEKAKEIENGFKDSLDCLKWAHQEYGNKIIYACSFGMEGIVLIDFISKLKIDLRVIFLDTGLHFQETYSLIEKVWKRYPNMQIDIIQPTLTLEQQAITFGEELWSKQPDRCCYLRKVKPLEEVLQRAPAWISGLRREQSETRKHLRYINRDHKFQTIKICPLIDWTKEEVKMYINLHQLDYNELHDRGYPSIGCQPCTMPAIDPTDERSGRWVHFSKTECGLHT